MKILSIGDVFGKVGRRVLKTGLNNIINFTKPDFIIANGENLAGGFGVTKDALEELFSVGVDVVTSGNHIWDKKESLSLLETEKRLLRPANYPESAPGRGADVFKTKSGDTVGVLNIQGRVFMDAIDCPFHGADKALEVMRAETKVIVVDMHAEATSEKIAMGFHLDGRVSAVVGTHTHVQTNDAKILPRQTAFMTDLGMTGPSHSVIGIKPEIILKRFLQKLPERYNEAMGPGQFCGAIIEIDNNSGKAKSISPVSSNYEFN